MHDDPRYTCLMGYYLTHGYRMDIYGQLHEPGVRGVIVNLGFNVDFYAENQKKLIEIFEGCVKKLNTVVRCFKCGNRYDETRSLNEYEKKELILWIKNHFSGSTTLYHIVDNLIAYRGCEMKIYVHKFMNSYVYVGKIMHSGGLSYKCSSITLLAKNFFYAIENGMIQLTSP